MGIIAKNYQSGEVDKDYNTILDKAKKSLLLKNNISKEAVNNIKAETETATFGAEALANQRVEKIKFVFEMAGQFAQEFSSLSDTLIQNDINNLNEKYNAQLANVRQGSEEEKKILALKFIEEEKIRKKAFKINKAFQLATAVSNTALAVTSALANPPGPPATIPLGILAGALGAVQIAKIAATTYQNPVSSSGGLPSAGGGVGDGGVPSIPTPATPSSFALFGTGGSFNQAGAVDNTGVGAQRVYVLESDITNTQNRVVSLVAEIG
jgi:hypothetical protein